MIFTIFKKELKDTLRDRRTLIAMLVVPVLVFPVILGLMTTATKSFENAEKESEKHIAIIGDSTSLFAQIFAQIPPEEGERIIEFQSDTSGIREAIGKEVIDYAFVVPKDFDQKESLDKQNSIEVFYQGTSIGAKQRVDGYLAFIQSQLQVNRIAKKALDPSILQPLDIQYSNVASDKEMLGKIVGGFLPYLFIIFGFIGCMYPAIDLFTGEKERKTLETLLTAPVARWKILFGKMLVVVLSGIAAATFALIGLFLALEVFQLVDDPKLIELVREILSLQFILMLYLLLIPLTVFFAGVMIPVTVYAKTFKEAQSVLTPINFMVILPALIGFIPGIELNVGTAFIPIVNIVLATKELVAGTLSPLLLILSFLVMVVFAVFAVILSYKRFGKESNIA